MAMDLLRQTMETVALLPQTPKCEVWLSNFIRPGTHAIVDARQPLTAEDERTYFKFSRPPRDCILVVMHVADRGRLINWAIETFKTWPYASGDPTQVMNRMVAEALVDMACYKAPDLRKRLGW